MSQKPPNVIVFGATGSGKSSLINMLDGGDQAKVTSGALGATFTNASYDKRISNSTYKMFDTTGLNEGTAGRVEAPKAIGGLYKLICQLDHGVNLLVFVMRAPRITDAASKNYDMFFNIFCQKKVPIVIVITGLEDEQDMDDWWKDNERVFDAHGMEFSGYACVTATRGKYVQGKHRYEEEYIESKKKIESLIHAACNPNPWKMEKKSWFVATVISVRNKLATVFGLAPIVLAQELLHALQTFGGLTSREAKEMASRIERETQQKRGVKEMASRNERETRQKRGAKEVAEVIEKATWSVAKETTVEKGEGSPMP